MDLEEEAFAYLESIPEMEIEQMEVIKEDTGMNIAHSCPFDSVPQNTLSDENEMPYGQKKKKLKKIKFSLGGLISNQDHFGNLDEFDHI